MRSAALILSLATAYLAVVGSVAALDLAVGIAVGAAITIRLVRVRGWFGPSDLRTVAAIPRLLFGIVREITSGSVTMLLVLIGRRTWRNVGLVEVPVGERTPQGVFVSTLTLSASPGSVLVELDHRRNIMLVNVIDASDPAAIRRELDEFYRNYQRRAVP